MESTHRQFLMQAERVGAGYALAAGRRPPRGGVGERVGERSGASLEFMDHREYQPGDDLRRIDWSAFARSDKLTLRLYREEVSPHLDILLDGSRSMDLPETDKARGALGLAGVLAAAAQNAGYTHHVYLAQAGCERLGNDTHCPSAWEGAAFDHQGTVDQSLQRLPPAWRARSIRVLISDLLWEGDPRLTLSRLARNASAVFIVQLLARTEAEPELRGNVRLVDVESDRTHEIFVDAAVQRRYREALAEHQARWRDAARRVGAGMATLLAEPLIEQWDLSELIRQEILRVV